MYGTFIIQKDKSNTFFSSLEDSSDKFTGLLLDRDPL